MKAIISWLHPPPLTHTHPHTLSHTPALLMATCKPENSSHMQTNICHSQTHIHIYIFTHTHSHTHPLCLWLQRNLRTLPTYTQTLVSLRHTCTFISSHTHTHTHTHTHR